MACRLCLDIFQLNNQPIQYCLWRPLVKKYLPKLDISSQNQICDTCFKVLEGFATVESDFAQKIKIDHENTRNLRSSNTSICRICLSKLRFVNASSNECIFNIICELFPKLNLINIRSLKFCAGCTDKIKEMYEFKTRCLYLENLLRQHKEQGQLLNNGILYEIAKCWGSHRLNIDDSKEGPVIIKVEPAYDQPATSREDFAVKVELGVDKQDEKCKKTKTGSNSVASSSSTDVCLDLETSVGKHCILNKDEKSYRPKNGSRLLDFANCCDIKKEQSDEDLSEVDVETCSINNNVNKLREDHFNLSSGAVAVQKSKRAVNSSRGGPFTCSRCDFETRFKTNLVRHVKRIHDHTWVSKNKAKKVTLYTCQYCGNSLKSSKSLKQHINVKHDDTSEWFSCTHCPYRTKRKYDLRSHTVRKHGITNKPNLTAAGEIYKCDQCDFETRYKSYLKQHHWIHDKKCEWFYCNDCMYKSKWKKHLARHIKNRHLKTHMRKKHNKRQKAKKVVKGE